MNPVGFKESNKVIGAGDCPNTEQLPVAICQHIPTTLDPQIPMIVSCWKLEPEELELIKKTGVIYVATMGAHIIPMLLTPLNPITELGYVPVPLD